MRRVLVSLLFLRALSASVSGIESIAVTVSDLDRSVDFYTNVLTFEKESEREIEGENWEHLYGVFGMKARIARLRLGNERLELMQFLAPEGRPIPVDSRSNDRWFQHVAIIVSDMDAAYARLRAARVRHASPSPQTLPDWNKNAGGIRAFYFRDPDGHSLEILWFPDGKGDPKWRKADDGCSSALTTRLSSSAIPKRASPSIATCSACTWRAKVRTMAPSRSA